MSFCQCILGRNGKCCRDQQQGVEWVDNKITFPFGGPMTPSSPLGPLQPYPGSWGSGSVFTYDHKRRRIVRKIFERWTVANHPGGPKTFQTWREAMAYACASYVLMNG